MREVEGSIGQVWSEHGDAAFRPQVDGLVFLSALSLRRSLWHVILDYLSGFWQLAHPLFFTDDPGGGMHCPTFDTLMAGMPQRDSPQCSERERAQAPLECSMRGWGGDFGLFFFSSFTHNVSGIRSLLDLRHEASQQAAAAPNLQCYKDVIIGYPPVPQQGMWNDIQGSFLPNLGDCLLQRSGYKPRRRRAARGLEEGISVLLFNRRSCGRRVVNLDGYAQHLAATRPALRVRAIYFEDLEVGAQLEAVADADIVMGPHGASFAWTAAMPIGGAVVVLRGYPNTYPRDYQVWAGWADVHYLEVAAQDPADITLCARPDATVRERAQVSSLVDQMQQSWLLDTADADDKLDQAIQLLAASAASQ